MILRTLWLSLALVFFASAAHAQWDDDPVEDDPPGTKRATERPGKVGADTPAPARVEFVESSDARTVVLSCDGSGADQQAAILDARWNCLVGFIDKFLPLTPEQKKAFEKSAAVFRADLDRYVSKPPPGSADGRGQGVKTQMRVSGSLLRTTILVSLEHARLIRKLMEEKILGLENFSLTLAVQAEPGGKKLALDRTAEAILIEYFTGTGFEVRDLSAARGAGPRAMRANDGMPPVSPDQLIQDSDLLVTYALQVVKEGEGVAVEVLLKATEPATGRIAGQAVVMSPSRAASQVGAEMRALQESMNDAAFKLWAQLVAYRARIAREGAPLVITLRGLGVDGSALRDVVARHCRSVQLRPGSSGVIEIVASCMPGAIMALAGAIDEFLEKSPFKDRYEFTEKSSRRIVIAIRK